MKENQSQKAEALAKRKALEEQYAGEFVADCYTPQELAALKKVREHVLNALSMRQKIQCNQHKLSGYIVSAISTGPSQAIDPTLRAALAKFDERWPPPKHPLVAY